MQQKVIQIGSSAGVTISKSTLETLGIKVGDVVETNTTEGAFSVRAMAAKDSLDPAVLEWTNTFIEKNRELLDRLKNE